MEMEEIQANSDTTLQGQYLIFSLGKEKYAFPITKIQEIMGVFPVTPIPNTNDYIKGVINLRGKIIAVVDLRARLQMPDRAYDERTCFIVVTVPLSGQLVSLAVVVDHVEEVVEFESRQLEAPADFGYSLVSQFVTAVGKTESHGDDAITLLDIDKLVLEGMTVA